MDKRPQRVGQDAGLTDRYVYNVLIFLLSTAGRETVHSRRQPVRSKARGVRRQILRKGKLAKQQ